MQQAVQSGMLTIAGSVSDQTRQQTNFVMDSDQNIRTILYSVATLHVGTTYCKNFQLRGGQPIAFSVGCKEKCIASQQHPNRGRVHGVCELF